MRGIKKRSELSHTSVQNIKPRKSHLAGGVVVGVSKVGVSNTLLKQIKKKDARCKCPGSFAMLSLLRSVLAKDNPTGCTARHVNVRKRVGFFFHLFLSWFDERRLQSQPAGRELRCEVEEPPVARQAVGGGGGSGGGSRG
jgi:hypothetical protein